MNTLIKGALVAVALAGAPALYTAPAHAAVDFSVTLGNAAFGYSDGYWDRDHRWHRWRNAAEHRYYREHFADHYYKVRHDHGKHKGWREERWWDHRG